MSDLLERIRSRGYWRVVIRPGSFDEKRVSNISALYPLLQKISVQLRGWDFPHLDTHSKLHGDIDWIGQESEWCQYLEVWRFYQSGQFVGFRAMEEDWLNQLENHPLFDNWPLPKGWKPGSLLGVENVVFQYAEIFELAARLSLTEAGDEQMHLEIGLRGLTDRTLQVENRRVPLREKKASIAEFPYKIDLSRTQLITEPRDLALKSALELFRRFGWDPGLEVLRDIQAGLLHRGSRAVGRV